MPGADLGHPGEIITPPPPDELVEVADLREVWASLCEVPQQCDEKVPEIGPMKILSSSSHATFHHSLYVQSHSVPLHLVLELLQYAKTVIHHIRLGHCLGVGKKTI